jgi:hypothetical protein
MKKNEELKIFTIKNPNKLISPFNRTHQLFISPPPISIKKKKKKLLDVDSTTSSNKSIDRRPQPLSSLKRDPNHCLSISLLTVINALLLTVDNSY